VYLRFRSRTKADGPVVRYVALAHNGWADRQTTPDVLMNLGRRAGRRGGLCRLAASTDKHFGEVDPAATRWMRWSRRGWRRSPSGSGAVVPVGACEAGWLRVAPRDQRSRVQVRRPGGEDPAAAEVGGVRTAHLDYGSAEVPQERTGSVAGAASRSRPTGGYPKRFTSTTSGATAGLTST
jgi:hypothetical protein